MTTNLRTTCLAPGPVGHICVRPADHSGSHLDSAGNEWHAEPLADPGLAPLVAPPEEWVAENSEPRAHLVMKEPDVNFALLALEAACFREPEKLRALADTMERKHYAICEAQFLRGLANRIEQAAASPDRSAQRPLVEESEAMTTRDLIAEISQHIDSVQGTEPRIGPYGALESIRSSLDQFEELREIANENADRSPSGSEP